MLGQTFYNMNRLFSEANIIGPQIDGVPTRNTVTGEWTTETRPLIPLAIYWPEIPFESFLKGVLLTLWNLDS